MSNPTPKFVDIKSLEADQSKYLVLSRPGIISILRSLSKSGALITARVEDDSHTFVTNILAVHPDEDEVLASFGADGDANQRALRTGRVTFVAEVDRIQIQFFIDALQTTRFESHDVFSFALPTSVLRLQRRESFRVTIPQVRRLTCILGTDPNPVKATIVDISVGGLAVIDANYPTDIVPGTYFPDCRILLPGNTEVKTDIVVRTTADITLKDGVKHLRAGCQFVGMSVHDEAKIQVYVTRLERESLGVPGGL